MIAEHHQRALLKFDVYASGGVSDNHRFDSQQLESAHRKCDFFKRVAFVVMHPTLHRQERNSINLAYYQLSCVSLGGRALEPGYVFIRYADSLLKVVSKTTE